MTMFSKRESNAVLKLKGIPFVTDLTAGYGRNGKNWPVSTCLSATTVIAVVKAVVT